MYETHISSIGASLGEPRKVLELAAATDADLTALIEEVVHFRESTREIWELAATAAEDTLSDAPGPPDLVLYVSENDPDSAGSLARIAHRLGLSSVEHLALSGRDCGNLVPALEVASALLGTGRYERVLLLLGDRARAGRRVMAGGLSVFSDGAASCLVTREPTGTGARLRVEAVAGGTAVRPDDDPAQEGILSTVRLASRSLGALLDRSGLTRDDFTRTVLPNYRPAAQRFLMAALGIPGERLLLGPVTETGHCFSADLLLTLARQRDSPVLSAGDLLLLAAGGPYTWSTMAVRWL